MRSSLRSRMFSPEQPESALKAEIKGILSFTNNF